MALNEDLPGTATAPAENGGSPTSETVPSSEKKTTEIQNGVIEKNDTVPTKREPAIPAKETIPGVPLKIPPAPTNQYNPTIISRASMVAGAHGVSGEALIVKSGNETYLRFENLKTINGPDLHIYLSADLSADNAVDLGSIRATEGNVNYPIPTGTDISKYKNALIWCRPFRVLFSYARL